MSFLPPHTHTPGEQLTKVNQAFLNESAGITTASLSLSTQAYLNTHANPQIFTQTGVEFFMSLAFLNTRANVSCAGTCSSLRASEKH